MQCKCSHLSESTLRLSNTIDNGLPILVVFGASSPIFVVVKEWTCIALTTESGRSLAWFCFVVRKNKAGFCVCACVCVCISIIVINALIYCEVVCGWCVYVCGRKWYVGEFNLSGSMRVWLPTSMSTSKVGRTSATA